MVVISKLTGFYFCLKLFFGWTLQHVLRSRLSQWSSSTQDAVKTATAKKETKRKTHNKHCITMI